MGAAGAFAPINFQRRVHCTRPDAELSYKWPFFSPKRSFLVQKWGTILNFGGIGSPTLLLKNVPAPVLSGPWRRPCGGKNLIFVSVFHSQIFYAFFVPLLFLFQFHKQYKKSFPKKLLASAIILRTISSLLEDA